MNDRDRATLWARETMEKKFVALDFETTGLQVEGTNPDEAVSLGLVDKAGAILMDTLLRHSKRSDPAALRVHGHMWEATREAPRLGKVLPEFKRLIDGKEILCYCVNNFDAIILINTCLAHCQPTLDLRRRTIQVLEPFAQFYGVRNDWRAGYRWQSLTTAADFFGIPTDGAHGVTADCIMTLRVVEAMAAWGLSEGE
jgi:DNA polymerase-3 subunit epsilon